ncbi:hypothetical protein [Halorussus pelagicus]|uniref:hypothetical protein n=1 Tax=Halorussus pelagicus TaxID=2505977 RepID=UPI0014074935|nr:hypothetical protein [Halorussus pelagicus]
MPERRFSATPEDLSQAARGDECPLVVELRSSFRTADTVARTADAVREAGAC